VGSERAATSGRVRDNANRIMKTSPIELSATKCPQGRTAVILMATRKAMLQQPGLQFSRQQPTVMWADHRERRAREQPCDTLGLCLTQFFALNSREQLGG